MKRIRPLATIALAAAAILLAEAAVAAPYIVLKDGTRKNGKRIRADKDGTIILMTDAGNIPFQKGTYQQAFADEPAEFARCKQSVEAGRADDATIKTLQKIVSENRFLNWDIEAQKLLAKAYLAKGDGAAADAAYKTLYTFNPELQKDTEVAWGHRQAMLAAKQFASLRKSLDAVVAAGPRAEAARAQNMRGDISLAENKLEAAVMDYLRTAILYEDIKSPLIQGEACFKAAQVLEQLRDPRAKEMYKKCAEQYRQSPYAAKAQGKF